MMPLVVAWFCECGSSEITSFCAAHLSVAACADTAARAAAAASAARACLSLIGLLLRRTYNTQAFGGNHENFRATAAGLRSGRLPVLPGAVQAGGDQSTVRRGAGALCPAPTRERAREERRRGADELRRAPVQRTLRAARAPPPHGRADQAAVRRRRLHAPVQDQRQAGLRRRRL